MGVSNDIFAQNFVEISIGLKIFEKKVTQKVQTEILKILFTC